MLCKFGFLFETMGKSIVGNKAKGVGFLAWITAKAFLTGGGYREQIFRFPVSILRKGFAMLPR